MRCNYTYLKKSNSFIFLFVLALPLFSQPSYTFTDTGGTPQDLSIDFEMQEVLLTTQFDFLINNTTSGLLPLNVNTISLEASGIPNYTSNWNLQVTDDIGTLLDFSAPASVNFPLHVSLTFQPLVDAPTSLPMVINLRISSNAVGNEENSLTILGQATKTVINYALVLDRSGSMNWTDGPGTDRRIEYLSNAVTYFLGLEQLRMQDLPDFEGDSIAIVKYNNVVEASYLPLSAATPTLLDNGTGTAPPLVDIAATNDMSLIQPNQGTATGNAVIDAINTHFPSSAPSPRKKVIILFSDGFENVGPLVDDPAVSNLLAARQDINIYTIGMGGANMTSLTKYATKSGLSATEARLFDPTMDEMQLNSFFFKIYQNAVGLVSIVDPTYYVNFPSSGSVDIAEIQISSSETRVNFSITHANDLRKSVEFDLIDPAGNVVQAGLANGINTKKIEGSNYVIYETTFTNAAVDAKYVGTWRVRGRRIDRAGDVSRDLMGVPVGVAAAGLSSLVMTTEATITENAPGEELVIMTEISDSGNNEEVKVEEIEVTVTRPDGKVVSLRPEKNKFGCYAAKYPCTQMKGSYQIYVKATIRNAKGERVSRDATKQLFVGDQQTFVSEQKPILTDMHIKLIIGLLILILILMMILFFRKRKG